MNLYPFDQSEIIVQFNARPGAKTPQIVSHKLTKPTKEQLIAREKESAYELHDTGDGIEEVGDSDAAHCHLWDKIAVAVQGYGDAKEWHSLSEDDKAKISLGHKVQAIRRMYAGDVTISDDVEVRMSGNEWKAVLAIGVNDEPDYQITFSLREPDEKERSRFVSSESSQRQKKGTKRPQYVVKTNLQSYIDLFDAVIKGVEGATVADKTFAELGKDAFIAEIDPNWKRAVILRYWRAINGALQD